VPKTDLPKRTLRFPKFTGQIWLNGITPILRSMTAAERARKRQVYSSEFKAEAVAKCLNIGVNATSKELGVTRATLSNWIERSEGQPSTTGIKPS
jgi:hypothetical protein